LTADGLVIAIIAILTGLTIAAAAFLLAPRLTDTRVVFDLTPDRPKAFGHRMSWLAIRTSNTQAIIDVLGLTEIQPANWNTGIGTIYDRQLGDSCVFVTPPIKGWTFVAGIPLPHPLGPSFVDKLTPLLAKVAAEFSEVQYFAAFPIIDFFGWARLVKGRTIRAFATGDEGVIWNRGRLTPEERALGLRLFDLRGIRGRRGDAGAEIILHPTEEQVLRLARGWSLDPSALEKMAGPAAIGHIAKTPSVWRAERIRKAA
jgi:hypothetical protein